MAAVPTVDTVVIDNDEGRKRVFGLREAGGAGAAARRSAPGRTRSVALLPAVASAMARIGGRSSHLTLSGDPAAEQLSKDGLERR